MKTKKLTLTIILIFLLLISVSVNIVNAVSGALPEPGSEQDPLVTKSYVDLNTGNNLQQIQLLQDEIRKLKDAAGGPMAESFKVLEIEAGQTVFTGNGTEIILRSGKASAIKGEYGGLADTTSARDLTDKMTIAANHLLVSSRDDGRGLKAVSKCVFLIRGQYEVKESIQENSVQHENQNSPDSGTVNVPVLNLRKGPGTDTSIAVKLLEGDRVTIISQQGEWYKVKTLKGITGWVMGKYID